MPTAHSIKPGSGRRPGHTTGALRTKAALYGLELGVESKGDGAFRYTLEDAHGRIYGSARGMMHAEAFLSGVETGWTLAVERMGMSKCPTCRPKGMVQP